MTSSFTKKQRDDTVSQTGKRSFSQTSMNNEQVTHDNTNNISFDIQVQNLMPLIQHLKQQNQQLKHERDQIQTQLTKLKSLSQGVLDENHLMKQHYQQRTEDIRKIVATMSINMNQEIEDINHMIHMTKNHNFAIVKNIQKAKKEINEKDNEVEQVQNELAELAEKNTLFQQEIITRNVKIRQMEVKMEEVVEQREREDNLFKLEEEVDRLVQEVKVLRDANMKKLKNAQTLHTRNSMEKPHLTAENINVIQTIKALSQQLAQLREDSQSFQKNLENLKNYHNKMSEKCQKANQQREHQTLEIQSQQSQIKNQKQRLFANKSKQKERQVTKSQLQDEKYRLQKEITKRKQKIQKLKKDQHFQLQSKKKQFKQRSSRQRVENNVEMEKSYDELTFKLNPQKEKKQEMLDEMKGEYDDLEREVEEMKVTIKNMDNPVKEIIRLEYELKRLKN